MPDDHRILCTRPLPASLIDDAAANGVHITVIPFILVRPCITPADSITVSTLASQPATAIFTSSNAVTTVGDLIKQTTGKAAHWKIYCLEGATLDAVTQYFGQQQLAATAPYSKELAGIICRDHPATPVLFFCGDQRRDELPDTLAAGGITLQEYQVYETIPTPVAIHETYDGYLFFSPSAVSSYCSVNTLPPAAVCFAIGRTTAAALQPYVSNSRIVTCERPGTHEMIQTVIQYFDNNNYLQP